MRVLHWNIHMWRDAGGQDNLSDVTELIRRADPDIVSLVEVHERWGIPDQLKTVADQLGYAWVFAPAFEYRGKSAFGNALLLRTPMQAVQQWQLLTPRVYEGTEPSEPRAAVMARIGTNSGAVWIGSTHFPRADAEMRSEASGYLLQALDGIREPWIVCGDFNQPPARWVPAALSAAPDPAVPTAPSNAPTECIDYCLLSGDLVANAEVLESQASDHLPMVFHVTSAAGSGSDQSLAELLIS